jgi:hypothetical protein
MAADAVELGRGLAMMMRGEESDEAEAATEVVAESLIWWRAIARTKIRVTETMPAPPDADDGMTTAERAYHAAKAGRR